MTKNKKIILGVLTFSPLFLMVLYFIAFFLFFVSTLLTGGYQAQVISQGGTPSVFPMLSLLGSFSVLFILVSLMGVISVGIMGYYLYDAISDKNLDDTERLIWILLLLLSGGIGSMVYWYMRIWKREKDLLVR
ncbi:hypothetical protein [Hugenholtzia roseola]|uniref:hypothetical protein n=1 Tax=Hugenholtzia roseola TaxID=1002 RepID=UPI000416CFBD|nr:hypothetical protein [Hugenholtzia roseola]